MDVSTEHIETEHIEIVQGAGGPKARIKGSRIRVQEIDARIEAEDALVEELKREWAGPLMEKLKRLTEEDPVRL